MKMFKIKTWDYDIEEVEVVNQTKKFVTIRRKDFSGKIFYRREGKRTEGGTYLESREEAVTTLRARAEARIKAIADERENLLKLLSTLK